MVFKHTDRMKSNISIMAELRMLYREPLVMSASTTGSNKFDLTMYLL
jgi:hypothetical protein